MPVQSSNLTAPGNAYTFTADGENYTILAGVFVTNSSDYTIKSGGFSNNSLNIYGSLVSGSGLSAINIGAGAVIEIGTTGIVSAATGSGSVAVYFGGDSYLHNAGQIVNSGGVAVLSFGNNTTVVNDGSISGKYGGFFNYSATNQHLINFGSISSGLQTADNNVRYGHAVFLEGNNAYVENWGSLTSAKSAVSLGNGSSTTDVGDGSVIVNHGHITSSGAWGVDLSNLLGNQTALVRNFGDISGLLGGYIGNAFVNTLVNHGTIHGNVSMGDGADIYSANGGQVDGTISGDAGDDTYIISDANADLSELALGGTDTVKAYVNWTLGAEFETLTLLGTADLNGVGNSVANTLRGNGGDNRLAAGGGNDTVIGGAGDDRILGGSGFDSMTGGDDSDRFIFRSVGEIGNAPGSRDILADFNAGQDKIDLSAIDAKTGVDGNQAFTFIGTGAFTHVAGQLHLVAGSNPLLAGDVNGDGTADFTLQLAPSTTLSGAEIIL